MHEATQRRLLRCAFLLLCVLPTLGVVIWVFAWSLPGHTARLEQQLRNRLGAVVRIDRVTHLRPGALRLDHLQLIDPETRQPLAEIGSLHWQCTDAALKLTGTQATVPQHQWRRLWSLLQDRLLHQDVLKGRSASMSFDQLTIETRGEPCRLYDLDGALYHEQTTWCADLRMQPEKESDQPPLQMSVRRERASDQPITKLLLDTHSQSVSLSFLPDSMHRRLGLHSAFHGRLSVTCDDGNWNGHMAGGLEGVDLKALIAPELPYHLDLRVDVEIAEADFGSAGLEQARGSCAATSGTMGRPLVSSLVAHHFGAAGAALTDHAAEDDCVRVQQLSVDWQIGDKGLTLCGSCPADSGTESAQQVAIVCDQGPLWVGPWHPAVHLEYLVRPSYLRICPRHRGSHAGSSDNCLVPPRRSIDHQVRGEIRGPRGDSARRERVGLRCARQTARSSATGTRAFPPAQDSVGSQCRLHPVMRRWVGCAA